MDHGEQGVGSASTNTPKTGNDLIPYHGNKTDRKLEDPRLLLRERKENIGNSK